MTKKLPKGLEEYKATLWDYEYASELLQRLKNLPGFDERLLNRHQSIMLEINEIQKSLSSKKKQAAKIAEDLWEEVLAKYSIKQLQRATGYDIQ